MPQTYNNCSFRKKTRYRQSASKADWKFLPEFFRNYCSWAISGSTLWSDFPGSNTGFPYITLSTFLTCFSTICPFSSLSTIPVNLKAKNSEVEFFSFYFFFSKSSFRLSVWSSLPIFTSTQEPHCPVSNKFSKTIFWPSRPK